MKTMYMHTLDGMPASWDDHHNGYIYYCGPHNPVKLVESLRTIKRQQAHDKKYMVLNGQTPPVYGYRLVKVPA